MLNKDQYINLTDRPVRKNDSPERKYFPETRTVYLSRKVRNWIRNRPRGIILQKGDRQERALMLDLKRIPNTILYGLSSILALTGLVIMIGKSKGELNGGNA